MQWDKAQTNFSVFFSSVSPKETQFVALILYSHKY
jgi:hypothetical protein